MRISLAPFIPTAKYRASRPMVLAGVSLSPGDTIPATIEPRRVRQLYEGRRATMIAVEAQSATPASGPPARKKGNR